MKIISHFKQMLAYFVCINIKIMYMNLSMYKCLYKLIWWLFEYCIIYCIIYPTINILVKLRRSCYCKRNQTLILSLVLETIKQKRCSKAVSQGNNFSVDIYETLKETPYYVAITRFYLFMISFLFLRMHAKDHFTGFRKE